MQIGSRTLQQLLVLSIAVLVPIEAACLPVSLPPLTTSTSTTAAAAQATAAAPAPMILAEQPVTRVSSVAKSTSSAKTTTLSSSAKVTTLSSSVKPTTTLSSSVKPATTTTSAAKTSSSSSKSTSSIRSSTITSLSSSSVKVVLPTTTSTSPRAGFAKITTTTSSVSATSTVKPHAKRAEQMANKYTEAGRALLRRQIEEDAQIEEAERISAEKSLAESAITLNFASAQAMKLKNMAFGSHAALKPAQSVLQGLSFQKRDVPSDLVELKEVKLVTIA